MRVLITGGAGLFGLNAAMAIRDTHVPVLGLHRRVVTLRGVETARLHLEDPQQLADDTHRLRPDVVCHAAALTDVDRCEREPQRARALNVDLAATVAEVCASRRLPLIHVSTDQLFRGETAFVPETAPPDPVNTYGRTKADAERAVLRAAPAALVVRTNFFGWGTRYRQSLTDWILATLATGRTVPGYHDVYFTPVHVSLVLPLALDLLTKGAHGCVHVASPDRVSKYDFARRVCTAFGHDPARVVPVSASPAPGRAMRPRDMSLGTERLQALDAPMEPVDRQIATLVAQQGAWRRELEAL